MISEFISRYFPQKKTKHEEEQQLSIHSAENFSIITSQSNTPLFDEVTQKLGIGKVDSSVKEFGDKELDVQIAKSVRKKNVYILQTGQPDPNTRVMETVLMADAARRSSAEEITVILPYFPYSRKDRKERSRVPISAAVVAKILTKAGGVDRIVTIDLHAEQEQGFISEPWDNLYSTAVFIPKIKEYQNKGIISRDLKIGSPDEGGIKRAKTSYELLQASGVVFTAKERKQDGPEILAVNGDVEGYDVIVVDDIIGEAGSLKKTSNAFAERGARKIYAAVPHAVMVGNVWENIESAAIEKYLITNSINHPELIGHPKFEIVSIAPLLANIITFLQAGESLEKLIPKAPNK